MITFCITEKTTIRKNQFMNSKKLSYLALLIPITSIIILLLILLTILLVLFSITVYKPEKSNELIKELKIRLEKSNELIKELKIKEKDRIYKSLKKSKISSRKLLDLGLISEKQRELIVCFERAYKMIMQLDSVNKEGFDDRSRNSIAANDIFEFCKIVLKVENKDISEEEEKNIIEKKLNQIINIVIPKKVVLENKRRIMNQWKRLLINVESEFDQIEKMEGKNLKEQKERAIGLVRERIPLEIQENIKELEREWQEFTEKIKKCNIVIEDLEEALEYIEEWQKFLEGTFAKCFIKQLRMKKHIIEIKNEINNEITILEKEVNKEYDGFKKELYSVKHTILLKLLELVESLIY